MSNDSHATSELFVQVEDARGRPLPDAKVSVQYGKKERRKLRYDDGTRTHRAGDLPIGKIEVSVEHPKLQGQERAVTLQAGQTHAVFILGRPGEKTFFREHVRVPVTADPLLIALSLKPRYRTIGIERLKPLWDELSLTPERVPALAERMGIHLLRAKSKSALNRALGALHTR